MAKTLFSKWSGRENIYGSRVIHLSKPEARNGQVEYFTLCSLFRSSFQPVQVSGDSQKREGKAR